MSNTDEANPVQCDVMLHPCKCATYNGRQCYNCLNGAHDIEVKRAPMLSTT